MDPLNSLDPDRIAGKTPPPLQEGLWAPEVFDAFDKMRSEARKAGLEPLAASGWRSYQRQREIWNRKIENSLQQGASPLQAVEGALTYTAIPGTSRHHWGCDLDIIDDSQPAPEDPLEARHFLADGVYGRLGRWLEENGSRFGFLMAYPDDPQRTGFAHEPWHYSYAPLARPILALALETPATTFAADAELAGAEAMDRSFVEAYRERFLLGVADGLRHV